MAHKKEHFVIAYEGHDSYGSVQVVDRENLRSLHFGTDIRQSEMLLADPYVLTLEYTRLMCFALLFCSTPKAVLFLGLGGGSLPKFFWKHFPQCRLDVVERSPLVIEVCYKYFHCPNSNRLRIYEADAYDFIQQNSNQYDLIFVDLYIKEGISNTITRKSFLEEYKKKLRGNNSVLILNLWKQIPEEIAKETAKQIGKSFGNNLLVLTNKSELNYTFLLLTKELRKYDKFKVSRKAQKLKENTSIDFPQMLADSGFLEIDLL